jgi:undecaprenyl-diphosphatase
MLLGLVGLGCVLGLMAQNVLSGPLDRPVLDFVADNRTGWLTSVMLAVTNLGAPALLLPVVVGSGWAWRHWRETSLPLVMLLTSWFGAEVLFNVVKLLVDRARPPAATAVQHFGGLAFPSGHATQAAAVWGTVAALAVLSVDTRGAKAVVFAVATTTIVVVGLTRIYLGAHWTSDVVGGWLLGGLWAAAVVWLVGPRAGLDRAGLTAETTV